MNVRDIIDRECINLNLSSIDKKGILEELTQLLYKNGDISSSNGFLEDVYIREKIGSTGIGNYIAMPHGKSKYANKISIAIGKTKHGVDWSSLDGLPVKFYVLFAVPEDEKLSNTAKLLSFISSSLGDDDICENLLNAKSEEEVFEIFGG